MLLKVREGMDPPGTPSRIAWFCCDAEERVREDNNRNNLCDMDAMIMNNPFAWEALVGELRLVRL